MEHSRMFSIFKSSKNKEIEILTRCPNLLNLHLQIHIDPFDSRCRRSVKLRNCNKENSRHENSRLDHWPLRCGSQVHRYQKCIWSLLSCLSFESLSSYFDFVGRNHWNLKSCMMFGGFGRGILAQPGLTIAFDSIWRRILKICKFVQHDLVLRKFEE